MLATRYNPNSQVKEYKKSFDLLDSILNDISVRKSDMFKGSFSPAINTREGEFAYHVEIDLPGIKKEEIDVHVEDGTLIISGERKMKEEMREEDYYKVESSFGFFSHSFSLPDEADVENIHAQSTDGVLEVVVPKLKDTKADKTKKIDIK